MNIDRHRGLVGLSRCEWSSWKVRIFIIAITILTAQQVVYAGTRPVHRRHVARSRAEQLRADRALDAAIKKNSPSEVAAAIKKGADITWGLIGQAPLELVIDGHVPDNPEPRSRDLKRRAYIVGELAAAGANVNVGDKELGTTPLLFAVLADKPALARLLIRHGAVLDEADLNGYTPLLQAAVAGERKIVTMLLSHRANPNVQSRRGQYSPLMYCADGGFVQTARVLLSARADPNLTDEWGETPLKKAIKNHHRTVARLLRRHGAHLIVDE